MENKHTPGPWHVASGSVYSETGATIAHMFREPERGNTIRPVERDTNAALIAAAPELLTAVYSLLAEVDARRVTLEDADDYDGTLTAAVEEARAALAKAEGRA